MTQNMAPILYKDALHHLKHFFFLIPLINIFQNAHIYQSEL